MKYMFKRDFVILIVFIGSSTLLSSTALAQKNKVKINELQEEVVRLKNENARIKEECDNDLASCKRELEILKLQQENDQKEKSSAPEVMDCAWVRIGKQSWKESNLTDKEVKAMKIFEAKSSDQWNERCGKKQDCFARMDFSGESKIIVNYYAMKKIAKGAVAGSEVPTKEDWEQLSGFLKKVPGNSKGENSGSYLKDASDYWNIKKSPIVDLFGFDFSKAKYLADESGDWYDSSCIWLLGENEMLEAGCLEEGSGKMVRIERKIELNDPTYFGFPVRLLKSK